MPIELWLIAAFMIVAGVVLIAQLCREQPND